MIKFKIAQLALQLPSNKKAQGCAEGPPAAKAREQDSQAQSE